MSSGFRLGLCVIVVCLVSRCAVCSTDPLAALSDEFDSDSLGDWRRAYIEDGWNASLIESASISDGVFTAVPFTSGWFQDYRGNFFYKELTGDFIMTSKVNATGRTSAIPSSLFSLGGIMVRRPNGAPGTWTAGNELWTFIAMGTGTTASTQYEVKTTVQSNSNLELRNIGADPELTSSTLQIARFGNNLMVLVQPEGQAWEVLRCYGTQASGAVSPYSEIPGQSGTLQVGMHMYTDWDAWSGQGSPAVANANPPLSLSVSNPDLVISYEFIRFCTPNTSNPLLNQDWFDPTCVPPGSNTYTVNCCLPNVNDVLQVLGVNGDSCVTRTVVDVTSNPTSSPSTSQPTDAPSAAPTRSPVTTEAPTLNPTGAPSGVSRTAPAAFMIVALQASYFYLQLVA